MPKVLANNLDNRVERMIERARTLFIDIAQTHGLQLEWDNSAPVELAASLPKQPGLDWSLWLNLQNNDEIGVQHDLFYVEWFPADDPVAEAEFLAIVHGLISGDVRLRCRFGRWRRQPYAVDFQREVNGVWRTFYAYGNGFHIGRAASIKILRNGHPDTSG
ncbi:hypothetical protein [Caulobacter henricii]|uniref:Uncharacterized protein n=1 Tax=Caulobacter henricii TaxID=69395 RepID=A0A0P0P2T3_9CAUL|nr:hypothetical protein [Caulobacter henricii]ALL14878.1 hypothetical protein AQ619_16735 [Caulobacter henricii]